MLPAPFVIYADFESITEKIDGCLPSDDKSYTSTYQSHKACSYGYKLVCRYDNSYSKPVENIPWRRLYRKIYHENVE